LADLTGAYSFLMVAKDKKNSLKLGLIPLRIYSYFLFELTSLSLDGMLFTPVLLCLNSLLSDE